MRRFGKRLAVIGLAVLTAVLAAGCGKKVSSSAVRRRRSLHMRRAQVHIQYCSRSI